MDNTIRNEQITRGMFMTDDYIAVATNLSKAATNTAYVIKKIETDDEELKDFLFTLGCYEGETITVISVLAENYVITVKDARYSIDTDLAEAIIV